MVIASEPGWVHSAGQAAGTILLVELFIVLFILLALMGGLAFAAWWVRHKVVPILKEYTPKAEQAMTVAQQGTEKVVQGVAEFYGRRQQVETSLRVLLFGRGAAQRVHEEALAQAAEDLQLMSPVEEGPGPANGWTPRLQNRRAAQTPVVLDGHAGPAGQAVHAGEALQPRQATPGRMPPTPRIRQGTTESAGAAEPAATADTAEPADASGTGTGGSVTWRPRYNTEASHSGTNEAGDDYDNFGNLASNAG